MTKKEKQKQEYYTDEEILRLDKAIKCIELIAENNGMFGKDSDWDKVYRLAHAGRAPSCNTSHPSWVKEIDRTYKKFSKE
jgi:hypothetical protein